MLSIVFPSLKKKSGHMNTHYFSAIRNYREKCVLTLKQTKNLGRGV